MPITSAQFQPKEPVMSDVDPEVPDPEVPDEDDDEAEAS
jgi:hypothetical protein